MQDEPITIGLDARTIHRDIRRGTGKNLIDLYRQVLEQHPTWRVIGYHRSEGPDFAPINRRYQPRALSMRGDRFDAWGRWRLPYAAWRDGVDVLHCPANECPSRHGSPLLLTVHDLLPLNAGGARAARFSSSVRHAVRTGATIITPSRFTAWQLMETFDAAMDRIVINPWAPDSGMRPVTDPERLLKVKTRHGVLGDYVLHLGATEQRKNTMRTLQAYASLPRSVRQRWSLLMIGLDDEPFRKRADQLARDLGVGSTVRLSGFADEADMPALFTGADVLAYPSLWEGFGLPIVDAWVTDTAVLTSKATSLPEVGADAAAYVDPLDVHDISQGLKRLLTDTSLRRSLIQQGRERLKSYTWSGTAERFAAAVRMTVQRNRGTHREAA